MSRAPFQILAIPHRIIDGRLHVCVFRRADMDQLQFIAGGGEDGETPLEAAKREIFEETGLSSEGLIQLDSCCSIPITCINKARRSHWDPKRFVMPEYSFAFPCEGEISLSHEHRSFLWMAYEEAWDKLTWQSNRTAMFELACRLGIIEI